MRSKANFVTLFYVLYFSWLLSIIILWIDPRALTYYLLTVVGFYFIFLYERHDVWFFLFVSGSSYLIGKYLAYDPAFAVIGVPPLGIPFWPLAWGISTLAFRKFYLTVSKGYKFH